MFQFPRLLSLELCVHSRICSCYSTCVPTFGYPRINAYLQLPEAFRSLSRPSSASIAKAFTMRPFLFNHQFFSFFDEFEILIINSRTFVNLFTFFTQIFNYLVFKEQYFERTISQNQVKILFVNSFLWNFSLSRYPPSS